MCGIAGIHRRKDGQLTNVEAACAAMLEVIARRGSDATGSLALHDEGEVSLSRGCVPAHRFLAKGMMAQVRGARTILLHTRWATVGKPDDVRNAHPQLSGGMAAIHNGTIYNADKIFHAFELPRLAEVDSEIIPAIVAAFGWESAGSALDLLDGGAAVALVDESKPRELILARTEDYPLCYAVTHDAVIWGSTVDTVNAAHLAIYGTLCKVEHLAEFHMLRVKEGVVSVERFSDKQPREDWRAWYTPKGGGKAGRKRNRGKGGKQHGGRERRNAREAAQALDVWTPSEDAELDYLISEGFSLEDALATVLEGEDEDWMWVDDEPHILNVPGTFAPKEGWPWDRKS